MQFTKAIRGWMLGTGLTLSAIVLGGCGSDRTTTLSINYQPIKALNFEWDAVVGVDHYRLLENIDGQSGYRVVANNLPADTLSYTLEVPLYDRINARYMLDSCLNAVCSLSHKVQSNEVAVEVEQLVNSIGYFKASDSKELYSFGYSVALSDDGRTLAVGAKNVRFVKGAVYIFVRTDTGEWEEQQKLSETDTVVEFGTTISLSDDGNVLAVGAPFELESLDFLANSIGGVHVFNRTGSTWSKVSHLLASNPRDFANFGTSLSLSGDGRTLVVGAKGESNSAKGVQSGSVTVDDGEAEDSGAAYVFVADQSGTNWQQQAYIKASNTHELMNFGSAVSLSDDGDTLAVGARGENRAATGIFAGNEATQNGGSANSGAVYLYSRNGTQWQHDFYVKASNVETNDFFGTSLTLSGDGSTLAVGADGDEGNGTGNSGAAYVFSKVGNTWSQQAYIKASNTGEDDQFGNALSLSDDGNRLVVSALNERSEAVGLNSNQFNDVPLLEPGKFGVGAAYVFIRNGSEWQQQAYVKTSNADAGDQINSVQLSGDGQILAVGSMFEGSNAQGIGGDQDDNSASFSGAVYLY